MFLLARDLKGSNSFRIRGDGTRKTMHGRLDNYAPLDKNIHGEFEVTQIMLSFL